VTVVVAKGDLAKGVLAGIVISALNFGWKMAGIHVAFPEHQEGTKIYKLSGPLFFASVASFIDFFDVTGDPEHIIIDFKQSHAWDHSGVEALGKILRTYEEAGKRVTIIGLNEASEGLVAQIGLAIPSGQ